MEHLYSQTGKTQTPVLQNPEEEDRLVEEVHDEDLQDDGFEEEIMEDITVPVLYEDDPCHDLRNSPLSSSCLSPQHYWLSRPHQLVEKDSFLAQPPQCRHSHPSLETVSLLRLRE
nr:uncharacterized protein LOC103910727 isoform X2 [Danio rerio]|eukprot:XP_021331245.1 uncharacterized protein LOC103910727 isoform X2 [Danio rerio]